MLKSHFCITGYFATAPLPEYAVEGQMDALMMDMEEDLAVLFSDDDFEDDALDGFGEEEVWEVAPGLPGSDAEIAAGVIIGEIGLRVLAVEGQMQVMASQMIQAVDRWIQRWCSVSELGQQTSTQRDEKRLQDRLNGSTLQVITQERHADRAAADYCYRDEQQGEHADAVHFRIGEMDCSLREKTTRTPVVLLIFPFDF
ncbi:hypothetical protein Tco_0419212 [Tanacetum coccineum]